ncbi:hypothetical protein [Desmospora activa]|nr:hypothetical protein [Desmospora activa]
MKNITIEKVGSDFPGNNIVGFGLVEKAFKHFYETESILEDLEWDQVMNL